jgi:quercetin dioxygenase-like cupin family protein
MTEPTLQSAMLPDETLPEKTIEGLACAVKPEELTHAQRARLRETILARTHATTQSGTTIRGESVAWRALWPHVWVRHLRHDATTGMHMFVFRLEAGGVIPGHAHSKEEECLVLEGSIRVDDTDLCAGDLQITPAGSSHGDITTSTGALLMVRSEIPSFVASR